MGDLVNSSADFVKSAIKLGLGHAFPLTLSVKGQYRGIDLLDRPTGRGYPFLNVK